MPDLVKVSHILSQPVEYEGQTYYTSQYFHQQYIANSEQGGKYRQHYHFLRLLRSIETYATYVQNKDIVEITYKRTDSDQSQNGISEFLSLFQATGYRPLTLLNATAQLAMSHHLDDELSKQMSVTTNTIVARQEQTTSAIGKYQDLAVMQGMLQALADTREHVERLEIETAKNTEAIKLLIAKEDWYTIEEFVVRFRYRTKLPERLWSIYGKHLSEYCDLQGLECHPIPVEGKPWKHEKSYPESAIRATLWQWLFRRNGQIEL